jgi:antitoxin ParD1/3/4
MIARGTNMQAQKISISLPQSLYEFITKYKMEHHCRNRSEVVNKAILLLQKKQLEECYREANKEIDENFEITNSDGLDENETW